MAGGESGGLFPGALQRNQGVAQAKSGLSAPLEKKASRDTRQDTSFGAYSHNGFRHPGGHPPDRDTRRDPPGKALSMRVLRRWGENGLRDTRRDCSLNPIVLPWSHAMGTQLLDHRPPDPSRPISASFEPRSHGPLSVSGGRRRPAGTKLLFRSVDLPDSPFDRSSAPSCPRRADLGRADRVSEALLGTLQSDRKGRPWKSASNRPSFIFGTSSN